MTQKDIDLIDHILLNGKVKLEDKVDVPLVISASGEFTFKQLFANATIYKSAEDIRIEELIDEVERLNKLLT
jgi:hypothetical protein